MTQSLRYLSSKELKAKNIEYLKAIKPYADMIEYYVNKSVPTIMLKNGSFEYNHDNEHPQIKILQDKIKSIHEQIFST